MKNTEFRVLLDEISEQLEAFDKQQVKDVLLPRINMDNLDMGQVELWKRLEDLFAEGFCHGEPDIRYDLDCEACRDLYFGNVHYALELIERYLSGELTGPVRLLNVTYGNKGRSHSVSISIQLVQGVPKLLTAKVEPAIALQKILDESLARYSSLQKIRLPEKLNGYTLEERATAEYTLFKQELP